MNLDKFYQSFIVRDFFAKVIPGGILILGVLWGFFDEVSLEDVNAIPIWGWFFIYGFSFVVGFSVQALGEASGIVRVHPAKKTDSGDKKKYWIALWAALKRRKPLKWFTRPVKEEALEGEKYEEALARMINFNRFASQTEKNNHERIVVIKETCGNTALSSLLAWIIWVLGTVFFKWMYWSLEACAFFTGILLLIICLHFYHLEMNRRQRMFENLVIEAGINNPQDD